MKKYAVNVYVQDMLKIKRLGEKLKEYSPSKPSSIQCFETPERRKISRDAHSLAINLNTTGKCLSTDVTVLVG